MKDFIEKYDFKISLILIGLFSIFIFLPFFIYTPLVQISMDTFDYSYLAKLIYDGKTPAIDINIDLPVGYPLIIFIIKSFGLNFNALVILQLTFYVFCFMTLGYQLSKTQKFGGLIIALTFILFSLNSYTIRHVFKIYPESFYTSFLVLLVSGLFYYFRTKNKISLVVILLSIIGAVLLRSNGIYLYFIFAILLLERIYKKESLKFYLVSCLGSLLLISSFNYGVKGVFAPFDKNRVLKVVSSISFNTSSVKNDSLKSEVKKIKTDRKMMFYSYFNSFFKRHSSYYYSMQKSNYDRIINNKTFSNMDQKFFDGKVSVKNKDDKLLSFMFQEANDYSFIEKNVFFQKGKSNVWLYSIYVIQEIIYHLRINFLLYIFFWGSLVYQLGLVFSTKKLKLLHIIYLIHLLSLVMLPFIHGRFVYRYLQVSEFIIYIGTIMFFIKLCSLKKFKKID
tara:strand:+ start:435 stop:1784 length:1350 start_codon:yes stop_codon:yes gene_type:complete